MVVAGLAVVVGIGLLILLAVAAARHQQPRRAQAAHCGSDGGESVWMAGVDSDNGPAGDCAGSDGGACGGDGGGGGGGD